MSPAPTEPEPSGGVPITSGLVLVFLLAFIGGLASLADLFITLPTWAADVALVSLALGMVLYVYLSYKHARASGRSWFRVFFATLWAPIKFIIDFTV